MPKCIENSRGAPRLSVELNDTKNRQNWGISNHFDGLWVPGRRNKAVSKLKGYEHFAIIHFLRTQNFPKT